VDGRDMPFPSGTDIPQKAIIKGDNKSPSIAAASIIAKVTRDRLMKELALQYPGYKFEKHKGYPTREHVKILEKIGPCEIHRRSFGPVAKLVIPVKTGIQ
jgi:ribonuclease HII